jgi:hypothetical protein
MHLTDKRMGNRLLDVISTKHNLIKPEAISALRYYTI